MKGRGRCHPERSEGPEPHIDPVLYVRRDAPVESLNPGWTDLAEGW
jgi:hypothetical protein